MFQTAIMSVRFILSVCVLALRGWCRCSAVAVCAWKLARRVRLQDAAAVCAWELACWSRCRVPLCAFGSFCEPFALWNFSDGAAGGRCRVPQQCAAHKILFAIWGLCWPTF